MSCRKKRVLYHVSPARHRQSIALLGLLPSFGRRQLKRVWLFAWKKHWWAYKHVSRHQRVRPDDLDLWCVTVASDVLSEIRPGVFVTRMSLLAPRLVYRSLSIQL
jgi:hypothetical protein